MLSERLQLAMKEAGISQAELARACHVKPPSVNGWLSGKSKFLRGENLLAAAKALKVAQLWLATGTGPMRPGATDAPVLIDPEERDDLLRVRTVKLKFECGLSDFAVEVEEEQGPPIFFRADWCVKRGYRVNRLVAVKVCGESMEPTLYAGDSVVINTADTDPLHDGAVYAINNEGQAVVKRLIRESGKWWMQSDNQDQRRYPRKELGPECRVVGRIVHRQSEQL